MELEHKNQHGVWKMRKAGHSTGYGTVEYFVVERPDGLILGQFSSYTSCAEYIGARDNDILFPLIA